MVDAGQPGWWQQACEAMRDLVGVFDAARRVEPRPQGIEATGFEGGGGFGRGGSGDDGGHEAAIVPAGPNSVSVCVEVPFLQCKRLE